MILTDREIQIAIENNLITIEPPPAERAFSSTTVDLTLDPLLSVFKDGMAGIEEAIDPTHPEFDHERALAKFTDQIAIPSDGYLFRPRELVLAWTREYIDLKYTARLAARIEGKSSLARLGVGVHITAPTIHAGFDGRIRLEMVNHGKIPVRLKAGMRICQLVFETTLGTPVGGQKSRFRGQTTANRG